MTFVYVNKNTNLLFIYLRASRFQGRFLRPQAVTLLESMSSNKQYLELQDTLSQACQFIKYPGHCLRDSNRLLSLLINSLYPDLHYLDIMR